MAKLFKIISQNKKTLLIMLGVGLVFSLLPLHNAQAAWWDDLIGGIINVGTYITSLPFRIIVFAIALGLFIVALVVGFVQFLITALLNWFIGTFLQIGITPANPATPQFVNLGWTFSRDFVNMLFILILVFIGLATILKLKEYESKKTLPLLIIIAILINFSGVIVGFIVDLGNIVTYFFLHNTTVSNISNVWDLAWNYFSSSVVTTFTALGNPLDVISMAVGIVVYGLILLFFFVFASFIYFVITLIFFFRSIALWILMVLAPFAFACYILPPTKKWWSEWWQQLIQWSIIGVPIGLFLFLSNAIISGGAIFSSAPTWSNPGEMPSSVTEPIQNLVINILTPVTALVFLGVGIMLSMRMAPSGASGIINLGKKAGMAAGAWAGRRGLAAAREKVPESWRERMKSLSVSKNPEWGKDRKGILGYAMKRTAGVAGFAQRGMGGLGTKAVIGGEKSVASKAEEEASKRDAADNMKALRQAGSKAERMGIIKAMMAKKQMRDAMDEDTFGKNVLTGDEVFDAYKKASQLKDGDAAEDMEFSFIHMQGMADKMAGLVDAETASSIKEGDRTGKQYGRPSGLSEDDIKKGYTSYKDKVIRSAKTTDDMKKFNKSLWKQDDAIESALHFDRGQITAATMQFGRNFSDPLQAAADAKGKGWFYAINPVTGKMRSPYLPKYFASTAAQGIYMPLEGAEDPNAIKTIERDARKKQKLYLERELTTATGARAATIKSDIAHIETEERKEREKMAAPKIEEEIPLAVQIKSAGGGRKTILKRALARRPNNIQTLENKISGFDDNIAQNEKTAREATEEIHRMLRIEKLRETDQPVINKRNEIESLAKQLETMQNDRKTNMETWHAMMDAWRSQSPESFIGQDIIRLREEEKVANAALTKMKTLGKPKSVIERATKDLERIKDVGRSKESELILHLRSKDTNLPAWEKTIVDNILNSGPQTPGEKLYYEDLRKGTVALETAWTKRILAETPIVKKVAKPVIKTVRKAGGVAVRAGKKGLRAGVGAGLKAKESAEKLAKKVTPERTQRKQKMKNIIEEEKESS